MDRSVPRPDVDAPRSAAQVVAGVPGNRNRVPRGIAKDSIWPYPARDPFNADFRGPEISQRFWPERAKNREKTRLGGGETLILFRPLDAHINVELCVDE